MSIVQNSRLTSCISRLVILTLVSGLLVSAANAGSKFNKVVDVGQKAPTFKELQGVDGKTYSLSSFKKAKAIAVIFTCNHCPVAQAYEERLVKLQKDFEKKGLEVVAISVSHEPSDSLAKMQEHAKENGFNFKYLQDLSQETGRDYGATSTPHAFLLDQKRKIAYMGAIDNDMIASKADKTYLRDAVEAVLAGKTPEVKESRQFGCGIQYSRKSSKK